MASTEVEVRDNRELRRVEALDKDGEVAGWAEYRIGLDGRTFDFTHTEVDERFEGQGIGTQLAGGVVEFVRGEGGRIVPSCSFIKHYMDKNEDTHDLLADEASPGSDEEADDRDRDDQATDDSDDEADLDSPDAGPADAKAAGSGGAADEEASRS